ncbi:DUF2501 domain-containing protein [Rhodopila sp.]|uniref:DUF2501 domain-containing protein n=1 Tax=Rhodopila sp. TaxID=2480087 RepID=UPI003D0BDDCE
MHSHQRQTRRFAGRGYTAGIAVVVLLAGLQLSAVPAQAQLLNQLKGAAGAGQGGGGGMMGGLGGGALPSVGQAGAGNSAGVLQYCVRNNYMSGNAASSVKNSLMNKIGSSGGSSGDSGFNAGDKGILQTGNGQSYSLGGSGIKAQATQKVCDMVLQHAKSLL